jgi:hypothetical protein
MIYSTYKDKAASQKMTLAILNATKRLVATTLHAGAVYKKTSFDVSIIDDVQVDGVSLTAVESLSEVVAGTFFNDRDNSTIYLQLLDDSNPNAHFVAVTQKFFFASGPVSLPYDLSTGEEVFFEPMVDSTSSFGVEIDTVNQQNEAIEGAGTLTLRNDSDFWPRNFDKLFFENQVCEIYSWSKELAATEAKLLFRGKVESKSYSSDKVQFKLKDLMANLKDTIQLSTIGSLGLDSPANLTLAYQRMIFGRVFGHRPVNVDALQSGQCELVGTIAVTNGSANVTGTGTEFLTQVSPDDRLLIADVEYTVASVTTDTALVLTENYTATTATGLTAPLLPAAPKRFNNRVWKIAGHALCEPAPTVAAGSSTSRLFLTSTQDIFAGDEIYVGTLGSGELVTVDTVLNSTQLILATSLAANPTIGTAVRRPSVQQVRINDTELVYWRDYTLDATTATLTLRTTAERDAAQTKESTQLATFTSGSRVVTGTGTFFKTLLKPGYVVRPKGTVTFFEVLSVDTDEQFTLRTAPAATSTSLQVQYKDLVLNPDSDVLTCEVLGRTDTGLTTGRLLKKAPEIIQQLLTDAGLASETNSSSFTAGQDLTNEDIAFVIPAKYDDKKSATYRDVINSINKSVFGILYQDSTFKFSFDVLRPALTANAAKLAEHDILDFKLTSTNKNMIKTAIVEYNKREYDYETKQADTSQISSTSDIARYILDTAKERTFPSVLVNEADAQRLADRWKFLLEFASNSIEISTKLQTVDLEINDIIDVSHRKLFERFGGTSQRKIMSIERIEKSALGVTIQAIDLSNAFNRVALISETQSTYADSDDDTRIITGYYKDSDGLIDSEESSFYTSLIW